MITRNWCDKIEPRIGAYFVQRNNWSGKYEILKNEPWCITDARINSLPEIWEEIEPFDSMVRAYAWLKKNVNRLL